MYLILILLITANYCTCQNTNGTNTTVRIRHNRVANNANHQHALEMQRRIIELTQSFPCSVPLPQLVYLDETNYTSDTQSDIFPSAAVLHRCENSRGLCVPLYHTRTTSSTVQSTCSPSETQSVDILFGRRNRLTNQITYEYLSFRNHTKCACS